MPNSLIGKKNPMTLLASCALLALLTARINLIQIPLCDDYVLVNIIRDMSLPRYLHKKEYRF